MTRSKRIDSHRFEERYSALTQLGEPQAVVDTPRMTRFTANLIQRNEAREFGVPRKVARSARRNIAVQLRLATKLPFDLLGDPRDVDIHDGREGMVLAYAAGTS